MIKKQVLTSIKVYQKVFSPDTGWIKPLFRGGVCRYKPTCSQYLYEAVLQFGIIKGLFLGTKRILRCHPWNKGGIDPVPKKLFKTGI
jgi:uncharacterized protein